MRLSADRIPMLYHDEKVYHPELGDTYLHQISSGELENLDVGGGEGIPTFERVVQEFHTELAFDVEVKEWEAVPEVIKVLDRMEFPRGLMITSFIPEALEEVRRWKPNIPIGLLLDPLAGALLRGGSGIRAARLLKCNFIMPQLNLVKQSQIQEAHSYGLKVIPWTVNGGEIVERLKEWGVDGVITDRPDLFL